MCGCGAKANTRTVWYVVWPDGSRTADFTREGDARAANVSGGGTGTVVAAQVAAA